MDKETIISYADDTVIISSDNNWIVAQNKLNLYLDKVATWLAHNKLSLNLEKLYILRLAITEIVYLIL